MDPEIVKMVAIAVVVVGLFIIYCFSMWWNHG